jgi:RNA polymerase sigma factor (sigma-70 family)
VYRAAYRLARNRADAEDLVQQTCVKAIERLAELNESQSVKAWILTVLHNAFVDDARRARVSPITRAADAELAESAWADRAPGPEELASMVQSEERLNDAWSRLESADRALLAFRAEGYSVAEIVDITGIPINALYARLYRARRKLARNLIDKHAITPDDRALEDRMEIAK